LIPTTGPFFFCLKVPGAPAAQADRRGAAVRFCGGTRAHEQCFGRNAGLTGTVYAARPVAGDSKRKPMDAQRIAVDAVVALTDCDREAVTSFIRRLYLAGIKDPKRLTFKGLQAMARA
jgi:hypothetical protein